jgi:hypothetical protein
LPAGFPSSIVTPAAWTGADFENGQNQDRYILILHEGDVKELEQACRNFQGMFVQYCPHNSSLSMIVSPSLLRLLIISSSLFGLGEC